MTIVKWRQFVGEAVAKVKVAYSALPGAMIERSNSTIKDAYRLVLPRERKDIFLRR